MRYKELFVDVTKLAKKLPTSEYHETGKYPIIDQGKKTIAGYTDIEEGLFTEVPAIIFGDHTRIIKYIDTPFFIGADGVKVIKCLDKGADYKYCYYLLKSARIPDTGYNRHYKWLKESVFSEHNKQQQKQIVDALTAMDQLIVKYNTEINILDELIKSRFVEMFGDPMTNPMKWIKKPLLQLGSCKNGMNFRSNDSGIEIQCLGVGDFKDFSTIPDTSVLPKISLNEMPSVEYLLRDNDIVFVRSNGNKALVGRCLAVYPGDIPTTFSGFCIRFRIEDNSITVPYLLRVLKTESVRKKVAGRGANIQNLNQKILSSLEIPIPPIDLQNQFADFVSQVDKTKSEVKQSIEKLETLKKSLMQEYF